MCCWYTSAEKLSIIYDISDLCWKCEQYEGTFNHLQWTCNNAKKFWMYTIYTNSEDFEDWHAIKTRCFSFGSTNRQLGKCPKALFLYLTMVARLYAQKWKGTALPIIEFLVKRMKLTKIAKLTTLIKGTQNRKKNYNLWLD